MRGYAQDIQPAHGEPVPFTSQVVGVVCASSFPEPELIIETLRKGQAHDPRTIWVVRDKDRMAVAALEELGVEYLPLSLLPHFKVELPVQGPLPQGKRTLAPLQLCDERRSWREQELIRCCSMVVVFSAPESGSLRPFIDAAELQKHVKVIVRGKTKARKRQGRKPVGV